MVAAVAAAAAFACTPHPGLGTVTYTRGARAHVVDLATCRERVLTAQRAGRADVVVSPNGRRRATVRIAGGKQTIWITTRGRQIDMAALTLPAWTLNGKNGSPGPIMLLGFWGDSRWLFYAIDPMNSASIVADGVDVRAVALDQDGIRRIGPMLPYDDYHVWCGGRLVLTAGADRIATHNKRLVVTVPPAWRVSPLTRSLRNAYGSLACSPDKRSVVVQSQKTTGMNMSTQAHWSLWRIGFDGSQRRLTAPPPGFTDESPRSSRDGRTILFVRSKNAVGSLYALRGGRILGPLLSLGTNNASFYGHTDWWATMSWSLAARP